MKTLAGKYRDLLADPKGFDAIQVEMDRQMADVLRSVESERERITLVAQRIREKKNILLLGMGASHFVNEIFSFQLRKLGMNATAMTASEFLYDPVPVDGRLIILTSQSGESVETVKCLELVTGQELFCFTLNGNSTLARAATALVASGGEEKAFAGTRSVTLTLGLMAFVASALGAVTEEALRAAVQFQQQDLESIEKALVLLHARRDIVVTGRSLFSGLAGLFSLGCEELGGRPVLCNETGQLRHGPLEVFTPDTVLVVFRQSGRPGELAQSFNEVTAKTSCSLVVFDSSGMAPLENAVTIRCPAGSDMAAVLGVMSTFQSVMVAYACGKNPRAGIPKYSSKVTRTE